MINKDRRKRKGQFNSLVKIQEGVYLDWFSTALPVSTKYPKELSFKSNLKEK